MPRGSMRYQRKQRAKGKNRKKVLVCIYSTETSQDDCEKGSPWEDAASGQAWLHSSGNVGGLAESGMMKQGLWNQREIMDTVTQ